MLSLWQVNLLIILIFTQILLWSSYMWLIPGKNVKIFWGSIAKSEWNYYLICALVAYILNLMLYLYFIFKRGIKDETIFGVIITLLVYYGLQMYFIPSILVGKKIIMRIILGVCVIPLGYLCYLSLLKSVVEKNRYEKMFLIVSSVVPFMHVLINDFIKYGYTF